MNKKTHLQWSVRSHNNNQMKPKSKKNKNIHKITCRLYIISSCSLSRCVFILCVHVFVCGVCVCNTTNPFKIPRFMTRSFCQICIKTKNTQMLFNKRWRCALTSTRPHTHTHSQATHQNINKDKINSQKQRLEGNMYILANILSFIWPMILCFIFFCLLHIFPSGYLSLNPSIWLWWQNVICFAFAIIYSHAPKECYICGHTVLCPSMSVCLCPMRLNVCVCVCECAWCVCCLTESHLWYDLFIFAMAFIYSTRSFDFILFQYTTVRMHIDWCTGGWWHMRWMRRKKNSTTTWDGLMHFEVIWIRTNYKKNGNCLFNVRSFDWSLLH